MTPSDKMGKTINQYKNNSKILHSLQRDRDRERYTNRGKERERRRETETARETKREERERRDGQGEREEIRHRERKRDAKSNTDRHLMRTQISLPPLANIMNTGCFCCSRTLLKKGGGGTPSKFQINREPHRNRKLNTGILLVTPLSHLPPNKTAEQSEQSTLASYV